MGLFTPLTLKRGLTPAQLEKAVAKVAAMTDPARLAGIAREAPEARVRGAAVSRLEDQALLAGIAGGDESDEVREAAVVRLEDGAALARIARRDPSARVRQAAARRVNGDALLEELARDGADEEVRVIAVGRMRDLSSLAEIARKAGGERVRTAAVLTIRDILRDSSDRERAARLDAVADPEVLERVLDRMPGTDANWSCRADIIGRLTDQATLARIARGDPEWSARSAAVRRLTDPATLAEIATKDPEDNVRRVALWNENLLSDPDFLARAALDAGYGEDVRCRIVEKGLTDPGTLSRVAGESRSPRVRGAAVRNPGFDDPALLARLAREDESADVRRAAVESGKLRDPALLARIALEDRDAGVRCAAIPRVTDAQVLGRIAGDSSLEDRSPRFLAALALSRLDLPRAVAPLVALIGEEDHSLTHCRHYSYEARLQEAFAALKQAYLENTDPETGRAIKRLSGQRYGLSGDSGCLHADYRVHFDLAR